MQLVEAAGLNPMSRSGLMVAFLYINTQKGATADHRVREAIAISIDYDLLNEVVYGNTFQRGRSINTPAINFYSEQELYPVDHVRARALLAEAGYADGLTLILWSQNDNTDVARAEFVRQQLAKAGITVDVRTLEGAFLAENVNNYSGTAEDTEWDIYIRGFSVGTRDSHDALGRYASWNFSPRGTNFPYYVNERFDELIRAGAAASDPARRAEYYAEAQYIIWNDFPVVPMLIAAHTGAFNPNRVEGVTILGAGEMSFTYGRFVGR